MMKGQQIEEWHMEKIKLPPNLFIAHLENVFFLTKVRDWWAVSMFILKLGTWGGVLILLLSFFLAPFVNELRLSQMERKTIMGEITGQSISQGKSPTYYITYQFSVGDKLYARRESVSRRIYDRSQVGSPVQVTYAISDPNIFHLGNTDFD